MSKSFASKKKSRLVSIGILLFIILIIPLTVIIAQQVQDIRQRATDSQTPPPLPPGGAVSLTMTPNIFNLTIGAATPTSAQIVINAGSNNITGVDFTFSYNPAMIKVVGFTPATGFDSELYKTIDNTTGKLRFAAVDTTTATANTGSVPVGTIQFSGSTVGSSTGTFQSVQITALGYTGALPNTTNDTATFTTAAQATFTPVPPTATNTPVPPTATTTPLPPTATATVPPATNTPTQAPLPGNFNGDSVVDILDFNRWRNEFTKVAATLTADANGDGKVDLIDFSFWRNAFGTTTPTSTTAPNPTATTVPPTPTRTPTPSPTIFITPTPIPTFSLTGQGAFNLSIAGYSLPLNGTLTFNQQERRMILTCKVSDTNCGFTAGLITANRSGANLYDPAIVVNNPYLPNGQKSSILQYANFNGQLTTANSQTTKTIEPNGSAISTYIKISNPQVIGDYGASMVIDARTCSSSCPYYGGSTLNVTVKVTQ